MNADQIESSADAGSGNAVQANVNGHSRIFIAAVAAFCTYFFMYAFRKPFTAGTFEGEQWLGVGLKTLLIVSQLCGYMLSKFIGIKVVSEMKPNRRAATIIGFILFAELALVGFWLVPLPLKAPMLFLNGLPLGMIFGLVLAYLEGRRQTEALSAALCASFIVSSGVVKSVGRWLIETQDVSEFKMPMMVGLIFLPPMLFSVAILQRTPPPDPIDLERRNERSAMTRELRQRFWREYWPGLSLLMFVYVLLTIIRTIRDDFGVEIWRDLGVDKTPSVFARSEMLVAIIVTGFNALAIWIRHNLAAVRFALLLMCGGFAMIGLTAVLQPLDMMSPFVFMVTCGVGMYIPYVAFHTTVFERLVAASRQPANVVFLMYVADAVGYLGYALVLVVRTVVKTPDIVLPSFLGTLAVGTALSVVALLLSLLYFQRKFANLETTADVSVNRAPRNL